MFDVSIRFHALYAVVVEFVVRAQCGEGAGTDAVGEEDLGSAVDPRLRVDKLRPVGRHIPAKKYLKKYIIIFFYNHSDLLIPVHAPSRVTALKKSTLMTT